MLSENLSTLADELRRYTATGVKLEPTAVVTITAILDTCAHDAWEMEQVALPPTARVTPADLEGQDKVVALPVTPRPRPVPTSGPSPEGGVA